MLPISPRPRSTSFHTTLSLLAGLLVLGVGVLGSPGESLATPVTSAANIPYSGISPGGVIMATGEYCVQYRETDLAISGPFPLVFRRYYASMLAREGLASGHLGPNWLGTYDWSLSVSGTMVNVVTNRGQLIQFQQNELGAYVLVAPMDEKYRLDFVGGMWRLTHPGLRRVFLFDGTSHLLTQILDEHGNALNLSYTGGLLSQVSDGLGRALTFGYDPTGLLTMVSDGSRSVTYAYTGGLLSSVTDAGGHAWNFVYTKPGPIQGLLIGVTEPLLNTPVTQTYDPLGRVMSQTDALGGMAMYSYDAPSGNVFTDPLGNMWTYLHDAQNRLMTRTDPQAGTTSYAYDVLGRPSMVTRPLGGVTSFAYDALSGYPSTLTLADGSAIHWGDAPHSVGGATLFDLSTATYPDLTTESYGRDLSGNLTNFTDRGGFHWLGTYNPAGQLLTATNPSGGVTTFTYDPLGRPASGMDNAGNTSTFAFDALSRLTQVTWPDATHRNYAYDNLDHVTLSIDERGNHWGRTCDDNGRLITETDPLSEATGLVYDALDRVTQVVDPLGHATGYEYDPAGRLQSLTDRTGRMATYQHDALGRLTGIVDPAGGTSTLTYDANGRLMSAQDPLGHSTSLTHDMLDRVTHVTDPVGTGFDYAYDTMGRLLSATAPLGHTESFSYDPRGLLASFFDVTSETDFTHTPLGEVSQLTDPNRNVWPAAYDPQGRSTSTSDPLARTTSYEYDSRSRVTHMTLPLGSEDLTYDAASRLTMRMFSDGTSLSYSHDDANRLTGATGASFAYDAAGRMINSNGFVMTYDNEGRILSETLAPSKVVTYSYDPRGLPSQMMDWMGGATTFTYDAAHRLTGITRPNGTSVAYAYDAADRLVSSVETKPGPISTPLASISITRDALGQPTSMDRRQPLMPAVTMPATTNHTYDAASQTMGFSWDPLGRLLSDGSRSFQWDGASRLTHYAAGADSPRFSYDAFGSVRTQTLGSQTVQQAWNYGHNPPTNDDTQVILPTPKTSYNVRGPSGHLLYTVDGTTGARSFYHYDEAGNTSFLTNDAGSVVTEYAYTPYGGISALGQTAGNPFTWNGASGAMQLGSSGLFQMSGGIFDAQTMRVISGGAYASTSHREDFADACAYYWISPKPLHMVASRPPPLGSPLDKHFTNFVSDIADRIPVSTPEWNDLAPVQASGIAEVDGNDMTLSMGGSSFAIAGPVALPLPPRERVQSEAGTLLHELGHNLHLGHGGGTGHFESTIENFPNPVLLSKASGDGVVVGGVHRVDGLEHEHEIVSVARTDFSLGRDWSSLHESSDLVEAEAGTLLHELGHSFRHSHGGQQDDGDGFPDSWETNGHIDGNCNGVFDSKRAFHHKYTVFGHKAVCYLPQDDGSASPCTWCAR